MKRNIDIVVPTLIRNVHWLKESIESVINEKEVKNVFLVVDQSASSKIGELKKIIKIPKVHILESKGTGIAAGVNTGISNVESDYVGRLDDDDISASGRFDLQISQIEKYDCDLVFASLNFMDPLGNISHQIAHQELDGDFWKESLIFGNFLNHSTLVGKTSFIRNTDLYPLEIRSEDYGFWLQIAPRAHIRTVSKELYTYRQHLQQYTKNRISRDPNLITFELWRDYLRFFKLPDKLITENNFNALHTGQKIDNSNFEIFLELVNRLLMQEENTKMFWITKLINKLLDTDFKRDFFLLNNLEVSNLVLEILFENANKDRKKISDLGKIGFDLQEQLKKKDNFFNSSFIRRRTRKNRDCKFRSL